jgi:hypothetical protein
MTRSQQETTRALLHAKKEWLKSYGWKEVSPGRWAHKSAPKVAESVTIRDAIAFTEANPLGYGST